jgi:IrrE N-terminal-like domain
VRAISGGHGDEALRSFAAICRAGRLRISQATLSAAAGQQEALLIPLDDDRFGISVDPTPRGGWAGVRRELRPELRRHRYRFRVAHEIAHTLFYDRGGVRPRRLLPGSAEEEQFCDEFARALLVPPRALRRTRPSASSIVALHRRYAVSLEVAARAMASARAGLRITLWYQRHDVWDIQWTNASLAEASRTRSDAHVVPKRGQALAVH